MASRVVRMAVPIQARESEAGVLYQVYLEAEIARRPRRGLHRVVGYDAGDEERSVARGPQSPLEFIPGQGAVGPLG